jgi:hypothetical protein
MSQSSPTTLPPANRLGLCYETEARSLGPPPVNIIDVHTHLQGEDSVRVYQQVAEHYGITQTWSMTPLEQISEVRHVLGSAVRFIAQPDFRAGDLLHAMGDGFFERIAAFHSEGAQLVKFWAAPRARDLGRKAGNPDLMMLDGPHRQRQMERTCELGMGIMTHIGDPDTWFATHYADESVYGTKAAQYEPFENAMDRFDVPWLAAHFGGWPEDLDFLDGLLTRHPNLHLDTSATKWMVRELSQHSQNEFIAFLDRWSGRILFGSDIVTQRDHLLRDDDGGRSGQASSAIEAYDLYASRYWALRTLFETTYDGPSPIADPDLEMVCPEQFGPTDAPNLVGKHVPIETLRMVYRDAAVALSALLRE